METIALLGATGSLGRALGGLLAEQGQTYRAVSRSQMALQVRFPPETRARPLLWDPEEPGSVQAALDGTETAIYLVGMPLWEFGKHLALTWRVLEAAKAAGLRRLLLVSSNWSYGVPQADRARGLQTGRLGEEHPLAATTVKGRVRVEQEQRVLAADGVAGLETAVLRAGELYGPYVEASQLWSAFKAARNGTRAQLMNPIDTPNEFVYVRDAARTILRILEAPGVWGRAWNLGGAAVTTTRAMVEAIFAEAAKPASYEMPPAWKMRLVAMMNPYIRELGEMKYLLQQPVLLDDRALEQALGGLEKTDYREGIRGTLPTVRIGRH